MRNKIPLKLRCLGLFIHLIGGIPAISTSMSLGWLLIPEAREQLDLSFTVLFYLPLFISIALVIILIIRVAVNKTHPFINEVSKDAIKYSLNSIIWMTTALIFCLFVFFMTCAGTNVNMDTSFLIVLSIALIFCIAISYSLNSIIAMIFTARGYRFQSPLVFLSTSL
jgi:uncharacterized Tic20 family protein